MLRVFLALAAATLAVAVIGTSATTPSELLLPLPQQQQLLNDVENDKYNNTLAAVGASDKVLVRRRRYVVFPKGSSLQLVYCMSVRGYVPFQTIFVFGLTAGIAWKLPTEPEQVYLQRRDVGRHPDREHRVNLFRSAQAFLNQRGLQGEECVQRTLCESTSQRQGKGTFMEEMLKVLFNLPESDAESKTTWDAARYNGTPCEVRFPRCSSILDVTLPGEIKQ